MEKPTVGRIVWFGMGTGDDGGVVARPAIVVSVLDGHPHDAVNLQVFTDAAADGDRAEAVVHGIDGFGGFMWAASVVHSPSGALERGTWCWPPRPTLTRDSLAEAAGGALAVLNETPLYTHDAAGLSKALRLILDALAPKLPH